MSRWAGGIVTIKTRKEYGRTGKVTREAFSLGDGEFKI